MREVVLTRGYKALVDDEDFEYLLQWKWCASTSKGKAYAGRNPKSGYVRMHRLIMKAPHDKQVDHINGNTLDNQKHNLRLCTQQENNFNHRKYSNNYSQYSGVYYQKANKKWKAYIYVDQKQIYLGLYGKMDDAIRARENAEQTYFKEFRRT